LSTVATKEKMPVVVYFFALIAMLSGMGMQATNVYLPLFAVQELDFSLILGGTAAAVSGVVGVVSRIGWSRRMQAGASLHVCCCTSVPVHCSGFSRFSVRPTGIFQHWYGPAPRCTGSPFL